ncbi:bifunctional rhamnulose-1-phosphate aldolase/short-chain dehydrogenase [Meiothermus granaticius]|uniref:Dihydroanticapsin 7-dehydrogenase n=1 Tax=Meiothermus granaticius NBRC 107808 TaxID=1227551 RepID=A0A399FA65_9DEIN|nr:bifunctional rhamnulose-1-phosphate aldolase/short-chain dehydrogenase [Meiothermus granaticius]RIH91531.1 Dihydroanticapsin 7-dehydrogenase [Meiothermus granaticius NBRC 107808]GEM88264.1 short chain dehydrogenase [Meiothermus granaticius NBRC 107808]
MIKEPPLPNLWDDQHAAGMSEPERLRYRSNLLGSDKRITNYGGGNTSAKVRMKDPLTGAEVEVLWVKGSGGDLGSIGLEGFATLYLDKLEGLKSLYRGRPFEDEMVGYLPHCTFNLNPRAASIDTPLHAYIPYRHVDHVHPDAIIAIAASRDGERLTQEIFGGKLGWLPWQRPGFDLGLKIAQQAQNPEYVGVILGGHGLFTWADTAKACYETTLQVINRATAWLEEQASAPAFGGPQRAALAPQQRREIAAALMPLLRGKIGREEPKIGHFNDSEAVLEFVNSRDLDRLASLGTSCPDHFLRTKIRPLVLKFDPSQGLGGLVAGLDEQLAAYREMYTAYYQRCKHPDSPRMRDPNAVVYLVPGVGMITFAKDKATARIAGEYYTNAIQVMRGAEGVSAYVGLEEQEAFDIEYWLLEEAKLQRMPKPKSLAGKIALITGGAGGIGKATAVRFLEEEACVVLTDIDPARLEEVQGELAERYGPDQVRTLRADATLEAEVEASMAHAAVEFGGLDILVSNAGIASAAPIEETTLEIWNRNMDILAKGYFLVSREAVKLLKRQGLGGSVVFVASKNGLAASPNAAAYCTAKAAEIHLARVLALELAPDQIRVNVVNPDAVLRGSKIWSGKWSQERAAAYKISTDELEEHYRARSLLKRSVYPEDVAEAIYWFASERSAKSTGNILNVDAGNAVSFTR